MKVLKWAVVLLMAVLGLMAGASALASATPDTQGDVTYLQLLDQNAIKAIVGKVDKKVLTIALKGTSEQLKAHLLKAMSQRAADMLREDMEALGPVKIKDVEGAQQEIINLVRELEAEGIISTKGAAGEQYVM